MNGRDKQYFALETGLIVGFAAVCFLLSWINHAIWLDEAYSITLSGRSWQEIVAVTAADVHPPLYYFILKTGMLLFGQSVFAMKMVSIIPALLTLIIVTLFLNREFSRRTAIVFLLCFLASNSMLFYSIEIRMYSWALFFLTMLAPIGWYVVKTGKNAWWALWVVCFLGAAYTHTYAAVAAGIAFLLLWIRLLMRRERSVLKPLMASGLTFLFYLPQIVVVIGQFGTVSSSDYWIKDSTSINAIASYIRSVFQFGNYKRAVWLYVALFAVLLLLHGRKKNKSSGDVLAFNCLLCVVFYLALNWCISALTRPLFVGRYLTPLCAFVFMYMAIAIVDVVRKKWQIAVAAVLVLFCCLNIYTNLRREYRENKQYMKFYSFLKENVDEKDAFVFLQPNPRRLSLVMSAIFPNHDRIYMEDLQKIDTSVWVFIGDDECLEQMENLPQSLKQAKYCGDFGWFVYSFKLYKY
jgi:uncharacterized membrane protein